MTTQLRDTQFGHLVRYLSGKKWFRYLDEVDLSHANLADAKLNRSQEDQPEDHAHATLYNGIENNDESKIESNGESVLLIGWYGSDDPEVAFHVQRI